MLNYHDTMLCGQHNIVLVRGHCCTDAVSVLIAPAWFQCSHNDSKQYKFMPNRWPAYQLAACTCTIIPEIVLWSDCYSYLSHENALCGMLFLMPLKITWWFVVMWFIVITIIPAGKLYPEIILAVIGLPQTRLILMEYWR